MFLHIGNDIILRESDIIAVCDMDTVTATPDGADFINRAGDRIIDDMSGLLPKSFIVASDRFNGFKIFTSSLNSSTLLSRMNSSEF